MNKNIKSLLEAKDQWESDIKMYKEFLKGEAQTSEGKYGAKEYIVMAKNRISDINNKLKEIEEE